MRDIPTLFIASSSLAKRLAEALAKELNDSGEVRAEAWVGEEAFANNRQILATLIDHSRKKDFAVVILTGDNQLALDGGAQVGVPRANCVFELGLFIGAFGQPERCFLLSSLPNQVLLDQLIDVGGQVYEGLELPQNLSSEGLCRMIAKEKATAVLRMVREHGCYYHRPRCSALTTAELLAVESNPALIRKGCAIMIKERDLPETRLRFAAVVRGNMRRPVNYLYLFGPEFENYPRIAMLMRSLVLAGLVPEDLYDDYDELSEDDRKAWLEGKSAAARDEIRKVTPHLFVELTEAVGFDEFCIHMADRRSPRGYLKIENDRYVGIPSRSAKERYEYDPYLARIHWPTETIFNPDRVSPEILRGIRHQIADKFPASLQEPMLEACFGPAVGSQLSEASAAGGRP